jgi:small-conductance mechanosensitive channel
VASAIVVGVLGYDISMHVERWQNEKHLEELDAQFQEKLDLKKQIESEAARSRQLEEQLSQQREELTTLTAKNDLMENVLLERQHSVPGILRTLAEASNDEVVLNEVVEARNQQGIHLLAWALTDTSAALFQSRLNRAMAKWGLRVEDAQITGNEERSGLPGYEIDLWLVPRVVNKEQQL